MPRFVVVDCNALDSGLKHFVSDDDHVVIPHALMADMLEGRRAEKHIKLFPKWIVENSHRIWLGHEWGTLIGRETSPRDRTVGLAWRDDCGTERIRRAVAEGEGAIRERLTTLPTDPLLQSYQSARRDFVRYCQDLERFMRSRMPDVCEKLQNSDWRQAIRELSQKPELGYVWAAKLRRKYYDTPLWRKALRVFPNIHAIGRVSRIYCWYSFLRVAGKITKFENNFEDARYAFTASYACWLATDDRALTQMVNAIFPTIQVVHSKK